MNSQGLDMDSIAGMCEIAERKGRTEGRTQVLVLQFVILFALIVTMVLYNASYPQHSDEAGCTNNVTQWAYGE